MACNETREIYFNRYFILASSVFFKIGTAITQDKQKGFRIKSGESGTGRYLQMKGVTLNVLDIKKKILV